MALSIDNRNVDLLAEDFDVAIRIGPLPDSDLIARRLASIALWTCASPAYLAARGTPATPEELRSHELIGRVDRKAAWRFLAPGGALHEIEILPGTVIPEPAVLLGGADRRRWYRPPAGLLRSRRGCPRNPGPAVAGVRGRCRGRPRPLSQPPQPVRQGSRVHRRACRTPEPNGLTRVFWRSSLLHRLVAQGFESRRVEAPAAAKVRDGDGEVVK